MYMLESLCFCAVWCFGKQKMYGIYRNLYSLMHLSKSMWWEEVGRGGGGGGGGGAGRGLLGKQAKPRNLNSKLFFWEGGVNALPQRHHISSKGNKFPTP